MFEGLAYYSIALAIGLWVLALAFYAQGAKSLSWKTLLVAIFFMCLPLLSL